MDILQKLSLKLTTVLSAIILLMGSAVADNNQDELVKGVMLSPPPGPFFKGASSITSKKDALVAPIAPIKPVSNLYRQKANSLEFKMHPPKLKKTNLKEPKQVSLSAKKMIAPVMQQSIPELSQKIGDASRNYQIPQDNTKTPILMNSKNAPIWMQRGSFVNQESRAVTNNKNQKNEVNMQYQNYNGMPNMGWSYPVQQYMYVPVPMMIPSVVPQTPLAPSFNYGAAMPFYNNISLGNNDNRAIDRIVIPAQKDNK